MTSATRPARSVAAALLVALGAVLLPFGVLGLWAQRTLADPTGYLATVSPLAQDPAVQDALATQLGDGVLAAARQNAVLGALLAPGGVIGDTVTAQVEDLSRSVIASPAFASVWDDLNRSLQEATLAALRGEPDARVRIEGQQVIVNTRVLLQAAQEQLADRLPVVGQVDLSAAGVDIVVVDDPAVARAEEYYSWLGSLGPWLLPAAVVALALGVLLARRRPRMLAIVGVLLVLGAGVVWLLVDAGRREATAAGAGSVLQAPVTAVAAALAQEAGGYVRLTLLGGVLVLVAAAVWGAWQARGTGS